MRGVADKAENSEPGSKMQQRRSHVGQQGAAVKRRSSTELTNNQITAKKKNSPLNHLISTTTKGQA